MKMDVVAGSHNDEWYTPRYAVESICDFLPNKPLTIWCPFDTKDSNYVKVFRERGYNVISNSLLNGEDFFKIDPPQCDYIISNPPYSKKTEVFERLFAIGKPFAMLVGCVGLFDNKRRFNIFKENSFEIMYFNKRIAFMKSYDDQKPSVNPPFSSCYICSGVLPKTIVFMELKTGRGRK